MSLTDSIATEDYFIEILCVHIDKAYQFALSLTCDKQRAYDIVFHIYEGFSKDLPVPTEDSECVKMILHEVWRGVADDASAHNKTAQATSQGGSGETSGKNPSDNSDNKKDKKDSKAEDGDQQQVEAFDNSVFSGLDLCQRAVITLNDHFGLSKADVEHILDLNHNTHLVCLASAREQIMSNMGS